jgi:hypothetical protein
MPVTTDILQSWRSPRAVIRRHLQRAPTEAFAFSLLVAFLVLAFVSLWPAMSRMAYLQPERPLTQQMVAGGLALLATIPLWYGVAAISHLVARAMGGKGSYLAARMALFMALLAAAPLMLLQGLTLGFMGQGPQALLLGALISAGFLYLWLLMLYEAERP